ncbi:MAG: sensor histidine kinase [Myxococcota bacterium]
MGQPARHLADELESAQSRAAAAEERASVAELRAQAAELRIRRAENHVVLAEARAKHLTEGARRYRTLLANLPDTTVVVFDQQLRYQVVEGGGTATTGWRDSAFEGRNLRELFPADVAASLEVLYRRTLSGESSTESLQHGDRSYIVQARPLRDEHGDVTAGMVLSQDVTRLKDVEDALIEERKALQRMLDEREVLLQEVYHRVKNNLQVVSSLLSLQSRAMTDPGAQTALRACQGRVAAMARAHEKLYQSPDLTSIDLANYLTELATELQSTYGTRSGIQLVVDAHSVRANLELCIPLGLITHELVANAFQHAFVGVSAGVVRVELRQEQNKAVLRVLDDGVGWQPSPDQRGLGQKLLRSLARQVGGTLSVRSDAGTCWTLTFPTSEAS